MRQLLERAGDNPDQVELWDIAVARFRTAEQEVHVLAAERAEVAAALGELPGLRERIRDADAEALAARDARRRLQEQLRHATETHRRALWFLDELTRRLRDHATEKPNLWVSLATRFRAGRHWKAERSRLRHQEAHARAAERAADYYARRFTGELHAASAAEAGWSLTPRIARVTEAHARQRIDEALVRWPGTVPTGPVLASEEAFQLCAPWADAEFTEARNRLSLAAMALHRTFVLRAARSLRPALAVAVAATQRRRPAMAPDTLVRRGRRCSW